TSRHASTTTVPAITSPVKYETRGSATTISRAIDAPHSGTGSPDEEAGPAIGARRDSEPIHVRWRAATIRAVQGDGPLLARGHHRLLNRRRRRDGPAAHALHEEQDQDDGDEDHGHTK